MLGRSINMLTGMAEI